MSLIWKYPLEMSAQQTVGMPNGANILHVGVQAGAITLWALVDPEAVKDERTLHIVGTGHPVSADARPYIGTVQIDEFVWHVFGHQGI